MDTVLSELPVQDLNDLRMLLTILSLAPTFCLRGLLRFLELTHNFPGPVGALIRMVRFGLRGIVISLYYSGRRGAHVAPEVSDLHSLIGYNAHVYLEPGHTSMDANP